MVCRIPFSEEKKRRLSWLLIVKAGCDVLVIFWRLDPLSWQI